MADSPNDKPTNDLLRAHDEDRRRKPVRDKLRREIQVLVNDDTYIGILERSRGKKLSEWVRDVIEDKLNDLRLEEARLAREASTTGETSTDDQPSQSTDPPEEEVA